MFLGYILKQFNTFEQEVFRREKQSN